MVKTDPLKIIQKDEKLIRYIEETDEKAMDIFKLLLKNGEMSEKDLAKTLKFEKENALRKILYKMQEKNIVSCTERKRGKMIECIWRANLILLINRMIKLHEEQIFKIDREMDLQKADNHYRCPACTRVYSEEEAMENNFICPYDKEPLQFIDYETFRKEKEAEKKNLQERIKELSELKSNLLKNKS